MPRKRKTELEQERMTDTNIERVIQLLNPTQEGKKPITKKDACQILGMAYNTSRLDGILEKFQERKARDRERRSALRGKPATQDEVSYIIKQYIEGATVESISKTTYRGTEFIKRILEDNHIPKRNSSHDYFHPQLIPDGAVRERFEVGEVVYSARYDSTAKIKLEQPHPVYGWVYRVWLTNERWLQHAYQPACELASLKHLEPLGVKF
jgi:hypothetical protein